MTREELKVHVHSTLEKAMAEIDSEPELNKLMQAHEMFQAYFELTDDGEEDVDNYIDELIAFLNNLIKDE